MRQLTESIRRDVDRGLYDGAVVMVGRGGRVECCEALGYADRDSGRAMREDDVFAIFSIAKAMTSVTVLQGIEKGAYTLRTPVAELVPEFAAEGKDRVTVGQLLAHTGGMNGGLFPVPAETQGDLSVLVDAACRSTLNAQPGERVSYSSGLAHAVLAEVVRRCDGGNARFRDILARDLFATLDMTDCALGMREDLVARAVPVVVRDRAPGTLDPDKLEEMGSQILDPAAETEIPAAGVVATAADVFTFTEALRQGRSLGQAGSLGQGGSSRKGDAFCRRPPLRSRRRTTPATCPTTSGRWRGRCTAGRSVRPTSASVSSCAAGATFRHPSDRWRARPRSVRPARALPFAGSIPSATSASSA